MCQTLITIRHTHKRPSTPKNRTPTDRLLVIHHPYSCLFSCQPHRMWRTRPLVQQPLYPLTTAETSPSTLLTRVRPQPQNYVRDLFHIFIFYIEQGDGCNAVIENKRTASTILVSSGLVHQFHFSLCSFTAEKWYTAVQTRQLRTSSGLTPHVHFLPDTQPRFGERQRALRIPQRRCAISIEVPAIDLAQSLK